MNDIQFSFSPEIPLDESQLMDNILEIIDKLLGKFMEAIKKARATISKYRNNYQIDNLNKRFRDINITDVTGINIEYNIPNINHMKIILDQIYINSYDSIPLKVLSMANNGSDIRSLKLVAFGDADSDTYSQDNSYIYIVREFLTNLFRNECFDKNSMLMCLDTELNRNSSKRYASIDKFCKEFSQTNDIKKTSLGKDIQELINIKSELIDYYTDTSNKILIKANKLRKDIKKRYKKDDEELYKILYRVIWHFTRMIQDANIYSAIKFIDNDINRIYSNLNHYIKDDK